MKKAIPGVLAIALLGGCSVFSPHTARLDIRPVGVPVTAQAASQALADGRQDLREGALASAIVAFRQAADDETTRPDAVNGLGVAYALLGRTDLAERYFGQAIALRPDEPRFAANFARFRASQEAEMAERMEALVVVPLPEARPAVAVTPLRDHVIQAGPGRVTVTAAAATTSMTRVSSQEIAVRTLPPLAQSDASGRRRNPAFSGSRGNNRGQTYPVRIEMAALAGR